MTGEPIESRTDGTFVLPGCATRLAEVKAQAVTDAKGRPVVETMSVDDMLRELVTTVRTIADGLESFDPSTLFAGLLGGGSDNGSPNPLGTILGSFVK